MIDIELRGIEDVDRLLSQIAPRQAVNIMRATIHGVAGQIRDDAKSNMRVDQGTMKRATKTKRERTRFGRVESTVRVGHEAFYWRYWEYGQGYASEDAMFAGATERVRANWDMVIVTEFARKYEAALARARRRQQA